MRRSRGDGGRFHKKEKDASKKRKSSVTGLDNKDRKNSKSGPSSRKGSVTSGPQKRGSLKKDKK